MGSEFRFADRSSRASQEGGVKSPTNRPAAGSLDAKLDSKKTASILKGTNPNEWEIMWSGTKLMWRTNDTLIIRMSLRQEIFACCIGNSEKDEEYDTIYMIKDKVKIDLTEIDNKLKEQTDSKWKTEGGDHRKELICEAYGNFVLARLNFVKRANGTRNVVLQKSGSDDDTFQEVFTTLPEGWTEPPKVQRPKRRSFQDFQDAQNELKQLQVEMSERSKEAANSQKAMHMSMQMLEMIKNKDQKNSKGLKKLRQRFQASIQMRMVAVYAKRLETSLVYKELLKEQGRKREEKAAKAAAAAAASSASESTIPKLPPISSPRVPGH